MTLNEFLNRGGYARCRRWAIARYRDGEDRLHTVLTAVGARPPKLKNRRRNWERTWFAYLKKGVRHVREPGNRWAQQRAAVTEMLIHSGSPAIATLDALADAPCAEEQLLQQQLEGRLPEFLEQRARHGATRVLREGYAALLDELQFGAEAPELNETQKRYRRYALKTLESDPPSEAEFLGE